MEALTASLMAIGSGSAAGLRPYFTVFTLGLAGLAIPDDSPTIVSSTVNQIPDSIANPWVLAICAILAIGETGVDKIPYLNISMDTVSMWLRPIFGSLVGLGLGADSGIAVSAVTTVLGVGTSLPVSLGKGGTTAATNVSPEPVTEWIRSLFEDFGALILVVAAIVLPILAAFLGLIAVGIGITLFIMFRKAYKAMKTKFSEVKQKQAEARALKQAQIASGERATTFQILRRLAAGATPAMATGVAVSTGAMRTGATAATSWTTNAATATAQAGSAGFRRAADVTGTALQAAKERMGPRQNTPPNNPPASNSAPPPYPARPAQPPYPQTPPPMPPQNAPGASNTATTAPSPTGQPHTPETGVWGPPQSAPGTPPPQTPGWAPPSGQPLPPERGRAQATGERAGKAVASAKGKVNKLRGQIDNFRNGFAKSEADTPEGDGTPPQNR